MESMEDIQINQLNNWLIQHLEPICDADPIVLAKYVIALIKKDKPEKNLRQKCLKQLEIFLGNETTLFVDSLFEAIKSKDYLKAKSKSSSKSTKSSSISKSGGTKSLPDIASNFAASKTPESSSINPLSTVSTTSASGLSSELSNNIAASSSSTTTTSTTGSVDQHVSLPSQPPPIPLSNQNLSTTVIGQNIGVSDESVYSRKLSSKVVKGPNDTIDPIDSSCGTDGNSFGGQQSSSLNTSSNPPKDGQMSNSYHNQYTVSSSSYVPTSQPSSSLANSNYSALISSVSAGASSVVAGQFSQASPDTFPSSISESYCPTTSGSSEPATDGLFFPHTPLSLRLNVSQPTYSLSSTQSIFAAPSVVTSNCQPYEPQSRYQTDTTTASSLVSATPTSSTTSASQSVTGADGTSVSGNSHFSRSRLHAGRSTGSGTGSRYRNSRSGSNSSYCSTCSGNGSSRSRSRSRSFSDDDRSSGSLSGSPSRSRDNNSDLRRTSGSRHRHHRHRSHHHSRREQPSRGSSNTNRSSQRNDRNSHRVDSRSTTTTTTSAAGSTYVPSSRSLGRDHHHSYGNNRGYNPSVGSSKQPKGIAASLSTSSYGNYRANNDSNYRSSRRNHRSNRYDDNDSNANSYRPSSMANYRSDGDKNATTYKPSSSSFSNKSRSSKNYSNSRTTGASSSSTIEGSKSYIDYSQYANTGSTTESSSMKDTASEANKYEDSALADTQPPESRDAVADPDKASFKAKLASLPPPPPLPHHLHHRDCPDMIQKGYCDKGQYCLYSGANSYIEPYNPEQTGTSLDPHMLMHMLPNFFMNNHRLAAVLNASGSGNSSAVGSSTPSGSTTGSGAASTTVGGHSSSYLKKRDNDNGSGLGSTSRPRELVGVSLTGAGNGNSDAGSDSGPLRSSRMVVPPSQGNSQSNNRPSSPSKGSRWPLYRNQNNKRANNIDILATSSSTNSNKSNLTIKAEEPESILNNNNNNNNGSTEDNTNYQINQSQVDKQSDHQSMEDSNPDQPKQANQKVPLNVNNFDKTVLVIRKIPPHLNTIGSLNGHFSKYGTVVYIQVCHDSDPESALVQFSNSFEATAAIRSTEAVFNNRFVKVFWANKAPPVNLSTSHKGNPHGGGRVYQHSNNSGGGYVNLKRKHMEMSDMYSNPSKHGNADLSMDEMPPVSPTASTAMTLAINDGRKFKKNWSAVPLPSQVPPLLPPAPAIKTISRAERVKQIKLLQVQNQSLQDAMTNQQHLMKKMDAAKTTKEKSAILKLVKITMKNVEEIRQKIVSIQDLIQPSLRTTKVNYNNNQSTKTDSIASGEEKISRVNSVSSKSSDIETEAASSTNDGTEPEKSDECEYADEVKHMIEKAKECELNFNAPLDKSEELESEEEEVLGGDDDDAIIRKILRT